jgi:hypothetical protein
MHSGSVPISFLFRRTAAMMGNINERIHKMWNALMPVFEVKELYDERYSQLI